MRYVRVRAVEGREEVEGLRGGLAIQELESFFLFWNRRNLPWIARAAFSVSGAVRSMSISSSSSAFLMLPGFPFSSGSDAWLAAGGVLVLSRSHVVLTKRCDGGFTVTAVSTAPHGLQGLVHQEVVEGDTVCGVLSKAAAIGMLTCSSQQMISF